MIILLFLAVLGALFVDIKSQVDRIRKRQRPSLLNYGFAGNILFAIYYACSGILGLLVSLVGTDHYPAILSVPSAALLLKTFYLGFAISTNIAFLSKVIKFKRIMADDTGSKSAYLTTPQRIGREMHRFQYELSQKF